MTLQGNSPFGLLRVPISNVTGVLGVSTEPEDFPEYLQFWDGRVKTLEEQAALPIVNPVEIRSIRCWGPNCCR
jgi:cytochrome c peroxidase